VLRPIFLFIIRINKNGIYSSSPYSEKEDIITNKIEILTSNVHLKNKKIVLLK